MRSYFVTWEIDIDAETPEEAAKKALDIQRDVNSTATFFTVYEQGTRNKVFIDLEETLR